LSCQGNGKLNTIAATVKNLAEVIVTIKKAGFRTHAYVQARGPQMKREFGAAAPAHQRPKSSSIFNLKCIQAQSQEPSISVHMPVNWPHRLLHEEANCELSSQFNIVWNVSVLVCAFKIR
jgi:hypothetical protein